MGFLIPDSEMTKADLKALRAEIADHLLDIAAKQTGKSRSEFIVRDLFPKTDLYSATYTGWTSEWTNQTDNTSLADDAFHLDWYKELPDNKFVCFYGVIVHDQGLLALDGEHGFTVKGISYRVGTGGATVREQVHLDAMYREHYLSVGVTRVPIGYHKPVYYVAEETICVHLLCNNFDDIADTLELELLAMVCEPYGSVISGKSELMPEQTSLLIPEDDMTIEEIKALRDEVKERLLDLAVKETGKSRDEFVVRDIFPKTDLGFSGCEWQNQTAISSADTWTEDFEKELPKTKFVAFFGVDYKVALANSATAGWVYQGVSYRLGTAGATTLKQVHLQKIQRTLATTSGAFKSGRGYHRPVYYKGTDTMSINLIAKHTVTQYYDNLQLLGMMCEPLGATISGK